MINTQNTFERHANLLLLPLVAHHCEKKLKTQQHLAVY